MLQRISCVTGLVVTLVLPSLSRAQSAPASSALQPQTHCLQEDRHPAGESVMHLWTGPEKGYYFEVGRAIAAASKHMPDEIRIHHCSSNGSATNLAALLGNETDFAIVQSDVMHQLWHCEGSYAQKCDSQKERVRLVTPLFVEKAQVLVRPHLYVSSLSELRSSRCLWLGTKGSGSEPTARMLLEAAGWTREQMDGIHSGCRNVPKDLDGALASLKKGEDLDAIIQTRVAPFRQIYEALRTSEIQLLGIDLNTIERMTQDGVYRETSIQRSEYASAGEGVYTIGIQALLVTRNNTDADAVRAMAELIESYQSDIEDHLRRSMMADAGASGDADSDSATMVDGTLIGPTKLTLVGSKVAPSFLPFVDPQAKSSLWTWPLRRGTFLRLAILLGLLGVVGLLLKLDAGRRKRIAGYYREVLFCVAGILAWASAALWMQAIEGDLNEHFTTLWSSTLSLAENVLAKLPLQFSFAPAPTTRSGARLVSNFSYLAATLVTIYLLPWFKKHWPSLRPALWGHEARPQGGTARHTTAAPSSESPELSPGQSDARSSAARA